MSAKTVVSPEPAPVPEAGENPLGPDSHPFADLNRLAACLADKAQAEESTDQPAQEAHRDAHPGAHPAALSLLAEKLGFVVRLEQRRIGRLEAADLPAIVLLANGSSRLALTREGEAFVLATSDGLRKVASSDLAAAATGGLFRIERKAAPAPAAPQAEGAVWRFFAPHLRGQHRALVTLALAGWLINLLGLALPFFSMAVFDRVIPHGAYETLFALAAGTVLALALEMALRNARLHLFDSVGQKVALGVQEKLASRVLFARVEDLPRGPAPLLQAQAEADQLSHGLPQLLVGAAVDLPYFLLLLLMVGSLGGPVMLVPLLGALALLGLHLCAHGLSLRAHLETAETARRQQQLVLEALSTRERIRTTGFADTLFARWMRQADDLGFAAHRSRLWQGLAVQGSAVLAQAILVGTLIVGVFQIGASAMTVGGLSACILLVNRIIMPVSQWIGQWVRCRQLARTLSAHLPLMEAPPEAGGDRHAARPETLPARFDLRGVSLRHPGEERHALSGISLTLNPGERIGIIGKTGCGKSSLLQLLVRLVTPETGTILLGGHDITQFDPAGLRRLVSLMPQESALFEGSLEDNLTAGLNGVDRARFEAVCRLSGVQDLAGQHRAGFSLPVAPGGRNLSGGERQSIALARTLMASSALYVLDEPTAAIDNGLEARIIAELPALIEGAGLIIATHRLPLLKLVDRVIWLEAGRVVMDGPRAEVFTKLGLAA